MKRRSGFVSNSSSSSFIITGDCDWLTGTDKCELNDEQKTRLMVQGYITDIKDKITLTQFISDSFSLYDDIYYENDDSDCIRTNVIEYQNGGHCGPYSEDDYDEISDNVYLRKENERINNED